MGIGSLLPWCGSWGSELRWLGLAACVFYLLSRLVVLAVTFLMRLLGNSAYAQSQLLPTNVTLVIWTRASITGEYSAHRDSRQTSVTLVIWMLASITGEYSVHRDLRYTKSGYCSQFYGHFIDCTQFSLPSRIMSRLLTEVCPQNNFYFLEIRQLHLFNIELLPSLSSLEP